MTIDQKTRHWKKPAHERKRAKTGERRVSDDLPNLDGPKPHPGRRMTEEEFLAWVDEYTRAEWVDGEVIIMSPVTLDHDQLQVWLVRLFGGFVEERNLGRICGGELWVRLPNARRLHLADLFFVVHGRDAEFARVSKTEGGSATCFSGAPDLVVEIVSPESAARDYRDKLKVYESSGVREYWIVDPLSRRIEANELFRGHYRTIEEKQSGIHSRVLKGFVLRPQWCWQQPHPKIASVLREMGAK